MLRISFIYTIILVQFTAFDLPLVFFQKEVRCDCKVHTCSFYTVAYVRFEWYFGTFALTKRK